MPNWREVLRFDGEDLEFETVHMRYRELVLNLPDWAELQDLQVLNWALDQARKELATGRSAMAATRASKPRT